MENHNTTYKPFSEKTHLSVSLCGQLGVKKNFLQRAFGKDWNADKGKLFSNESDSTVPKDARPETPTKETRDYDTTPEQSEMFIHNTVSPHRSYRRAKTSCDQLSAIGKSDCEKQNCDTMSSQHRISDKSKVVIVSPLVTKRKGNKSDGTKMQECPELQLKVLSQCQPLVPRSNIFCATRKVLTPLKTQINEVKIERTSYPITPLTKRLENGSYSENKRLDSSNNISSGFSVKRRIFSHDDKENQLPYCTQDIMIPNRMGAKGTNSPPLSKLKSLSQEARTNQMEFPETQTTDPDAFCKSHSKQNFSVNVRQLTSQQPSSNPMSVSLPCPSSSHCVRHPEDDKMKETKLDLESPVLPKPATGVAHHLAITYASVSKGGIDCRLTPAYKQSVVTAKQTSSNIHLPASFIQNNVSNTPAAHIEIYNEEQCIEPERDSVLSKEHGDESNISSAHLEDKRSLIDSSSSHKPSLSDTIYVSSSLDKDNINHLHSASRDSGYPDPAPNSDNQRADSDNPKNPDSDNQKNPDSNNHKKTLPKMSHYHYPHVFGSPPGNLPLEVIRQLQLSSYGAGTRMVPMTTTAATGVPSIHPSLGALLNQGQVPIYSSTPSHSYLSPYIGPMVRPMYASTPNASSVDSKEWQQNLHLPLPATSQIHPMYTSTSNSSSIDSKDWQQSLRLPLATATQISHQYQGLHHLAATGQSAFLTPPMFPYTVFPQSHKFITQTPYTATRPQGNEPAEQNLPLDLSGMGRNEDIAGSSKPIPCRKTLFPPNRPNGVTLPASQLARLTTDGGFNSSGDSAYKSDEDRRTPESQINGDRSSTEGRDTDGSNNVKTEEKNPFGIHKILGVQKSPVKPKQIGNHDGYCGYMMLPTNGAKAPNAAVRRPAKRRFSACDDTDEDLPSAKKKSRDKPPLWGREMPDPPINFEESEERKRFCDADLRYQVPEVPEELDEQENLRLALLRLFEKSDLPSVPEQLKENLFGLRFFPRMSTLFQAQHFYDIRKLNISPSGLAFENFRIEENNSMIDKMLRKEGDIYHCLGRKCIDSLDSVCSFTAKTLGKMRRHVKNHLPDKKWVCCFCRAQMTDQTDMSRHGTTHTMLRPFYCAPCGKTFTQKVTLVNHLRTNHSMTEEEEDTKDRYTCRQCGVHYKASQRQECVEHLYKFHHNTLYVSLKKRNRFPFNSEEEL